MRGDRLREIREARQLSQKDLAERIGVNQQQVYRYEKGDNDPAADVLMRIAKELEVSADYLLGLVQHPTEHLTEEELSPMERRLISAYRKGLIVEAMKTLISDNQETDKPHIPADKPAIDS